METSAWLGIGSLIVIVSFIVFAFRQGMKVKRPPQGVPPEITPPPPSL
jgi:hypothetical protein